MKCEQEYCLYNQNFCCSLDSIEINALGMCGACILLSLEEDFREAEKSRQLQELENPFYQQPRL